MAEGKDGVEEPSLRWDAWGPAREAVFASRLGTKGGGTRLVVVVFAHRWNPAALHVATLFDKLRLLPDYTYAQIFVVDADREREVCWEHGVHTTPALVLFWDGDAMEVRRPGWDDDRKCTLPLARRRARRSARVPLRAGRTFSRAVSPSSAPSAPAARSCGHAGP